jgi:hypothetical protein
MTIVLTSTKRIDWARPDGCPAGFEPEFVVVGNSDAGGMALEVAVSKWTKSEPPTRETLTRLHTLRVNKRAQPVVLVVETSAGAIVFGPNSASAPLGPLPVEQSQRVIQAALDEPTVIAARARLAGLVQSIDSTAMPGVKNSGLFANHELRVGVPARADWQAACERSAALLASKGQQLIEKLGFKVGRAGAHAMVLSGKGPHPQAIAVMLDEREAFDADSPRFAVSPVAYGLRMAEQQGVPWLIMLRGTQLRLYPARIEFGVGRKGLAETFFEVDLPQLTRDNAGYVDLIFSATALEENGTAYEILKSSAQYAVELGERLRDKVYEEIIPDLSLAIADALIERDYEMDAEGLDLAYQLTLRVFFRMLFQVYAEDRKLLPYGENTKYDRNAIKTMAKDFVDNPDQEFDEDSTSLWDDLAQVWRVIDSGDRAWGVPAYNGGLFASDKEINEHGHILKDIHLSNAVMGPVLKALLLDEADDGEIGQIDFRSLSVREFGTIYEGLLESSLGLAEVDLTLDDKGTWIPAKKKDEVYAYAGQVYFHNTSGQRKGTGSYFTPSFVVEHLLERSLDPALDAHLEKVKALIAKQDHASAGELFFDFRVADLAMGSGHFLTSAIDHIEQRMAAFLAEEGNLIPGVNAELQKLEQAAIEALGPDAPEPERSSLLRRQIARRCIYGLDINPIAVELARVSIWIHTFVRGLPMSSLDHNLVCANSLTGIGSVEEALDVLVPGRKGNPTFFDEPIVEALESARTVLVDAALLAESTKEESRAASRASRKALKEAETAKLLFDAAVLTRIGLGDLVAGSTPSAIAKMAAGEHVQSELASLKPAHMPALFPEVFLRQNSGFDVLIGNPPWDMVHVEEDVWWGKFIPGVRGLPVKEMNSAISKFRKSRPDLEGEFEQERHSADVLRAVLLSGPYPGIGSGHVDLYQVFAWRNLQCCNEGGAVGVVLPRVALSGSGSALWRSDVLREGTLDVVFVVNNKEWVFKGVDGRYSIAFVVVRPKATLASVKLSGPFFSKEEFDKSWETQLELSTKTIAAGSTTMAIPILSSLDIGNIYEQIRRSPSLGQHPMFQVRPIQGDLNAAADKGQFVKGGEVTENRVPVFAGATFEIWEPDFGQPYGAANFEKISKWLLAKCQSASRNSRSAHYGSEYKKVDDIPFSTPRIAYRGVSNSTNSRTFICCLVPPNVVMTHGSPYLKFIAGEASDEPYLLGVLSSIPFDWYMRKWVELNVTFELVLPAPIPIVNREDLRYQRLVTLSVELASKDSRYAEWARKFGIKTGQMRNDNDRFDAMAEIDAIVAHLYGLNRSQVEQIFKTFHRGWDYAPRLEKVLSFYDKLSKVES